MLVLTRKPDESILIGDNIRVVICRVNGDKVRIGIEAPADVRILRTELIPHVEDGRDAKTPAQK